MQASNSNEEVVVVTVHGTGDGAVEADGNKWWQRGSKFCKDLQAHLSSAGIQSSIRPLHWSGENNVLERERAAIALSALIRRSAKHHRVHIVSHSHGGNVACDAALYLRWGRKPGPSPIATLTTVGTPYFKTLVSRFQRGGALAFLIIAFASLIILSAVSIASLWLSFANSAVSWRTGLVAALWAIGATASYFMIRQALLGVRRVSANGSRAASNATVFSIWHPADEAISVLRGASSLSIAPFATGSLLLGSRSSAILWAVRLVIVFVLLAFVFLASSLLGFGQAATAWLAAIGLGDLGAWLNADTGGFGVTREDPFTYLQAAAMILGMAAALWMAIYLIIRFTFGLVPELMLRRQLNASLAEIFRGMAFGSVGDQRPVAVDTCSPAFNAIRHELGGELAERLKVKSETAATALLAKYRWDFFSVDADYTSLFERMPKDAMTWDSLVHTSYFDEPEIAEMIAQHIAAAECAARAAAEIGP